MGNGGAIAGGEDMEVARLDAEEHLGSRPGADLLMRYRDDSAPGDLGCDMGLVAQPLAGHDTRFQALAADMYRMRAHPQHQGSFLLQALAQFGREVACLV